MSFYDTAIPLLCHEHDGFIVDPSAFNGILQQSNLLDRKVVVISIVGEYRRGKSFFLNFIMRYLMNQGNPNWMHSDASLLKGFSWRRGIKRETDGIVMWSRAFPLGNEYAVILLDTEGTYDEQSTNKTMSHVFACSALISSVQIFNVHEKINKRTMHEIQSFAEFGRLASCREAEHAFQNLIFLVRDWYFDSDFDFGIHGGQNYLNHWLKKDNDGVQMTLKKCFSQVNCNLLPYPGDKVKNDKKFEGNISEMNESFCMHIKKIIEYIFSPAYLQCKRIGGKELKLKDFMTYFTMFAESLNETGVEPQSLFKSQVESCNINAKDAAVQFYLANMDELTQGDEPLTDDVLEVIHKGVTTEAVCIFDEFPKVGGNDHATLYRINLFQELEHLYLKYLNKDAHKTIVQSHVARKDQEILDVENQRIKQELEHKHALETLLLQKIVLEEKIELQKQRQLEQLKEELHRTEQQAAYETEKLRQMFQQQIRDLQNDDDCSREEINRLKRKHEKKLRKVQEMADNRVRNMREDADSLCSIS